MPFYAVRAVATGARAAALAVHDVGRGRGGAPVRTDWAPRSRDRRGVGVGRGPVRILRARRAGRSDITVGRGAEGHGRRRPGAAAPAVGRAGHPSAVDGPDRLVGVGDGRRVKRGVGRLPDAPDDDRHGRHPPRRLPGRPGGDRDGAETRNARARHLVRGHHRAGAAVRAPAIDRAAAARPSRAGTSLR